jgi:hypothetical protein
MAFGPFLCCHNFSGMGFPAALRPIFGIAGLGKRLMCYSCTPSGIFLESRNRKAASSYMEAARGASGQIHIGLIYRCCNTKNRLPSWWVSYPKKIMATHEKAKSHL